MKRIGVALVGLGPGAQPHVQSLAELQHELDVRWAICRHPSAAEPGALPASARITSDIQQALDGKDVDMAIIATPAATHLEIAGRFLDAGKHTLVEKPLDVSLARAEELVRRGERSGRQLGVVLQHRFRPGALRLAALLASGEAGTLQSACVSVPWWRSQSGYYGKAGRGTRARDGGGVLLTQAIHAIDLFRSLVGVRTVDAAQAITTAVHQIETEDLVSALLTLGNGAPGTLWATTALYPGRPESIEMIFDRAALNLTGGRLEVSYHDGCSLVVDAEGKSGSGDNIMDFSHEAHKALIQDFVQAVRSGRTPAVSGADALQTHRLIERILEVARASPTT